MRNFRRQRIKRRSRHKASHRLYRLLAMCTAVSLVLFGMGWFLLLHTKLRGDEQTLYVPLKTEGKRIQMFGRVDDWKIDSTETLDENWKRGPLVIFYNVYIPISPYPNQVQAAIDIVKEQIEQIARSAAVRDTVNVYYNLIGNDKAWPESQFSQYCRSANSNLFCHQIGHYLNATETVTLQNLYDFCHNHTDHRVTYIHSKGTFHPSSKNTHWRRLLTAGALHSGCLHPPQYCNLCGVQFFTQFTFFVPGNMFTADCQYVQTLVPLDKYPSLRTRAVQELLLYKLRNQLRNTLLRDQLDFLGMDRYADEHWIGSGPDIVPCDVDPYGIIQHLYNATRKFSEFSWQLGPRHRGIVGGLDEERQVVLQNNPTLRQREVLLLPGLLIKWWVLYKRMPKPSSWVWSFFADGDYWLKLMQQNGAEHVVSVATSGYYDSVDGSSLNTAFAKPPPMLLNNCTLTEEEKVAKSTATRFAVFYHVAVPQHGNISMIEEQLKILGNSFVGSQTDPVTTLFYTAAGSSAVARTKLIALIQHSCPPNLHCRLLQNLDENYEGETLRQLHRFCSVHPSFRVAYLHNQGPMHLRRFGNNEKLIRHLTMAATSRLCLQPKDESCNVCGLVFYTVWTYFFPGNMFAASCQYVTKLLPPHEFEPSMERFLRELLLRRLRLQITTNLFPDRPMYFGLDRFALEHWVGSHPTLIPCDLSNARQTLAYWRTADRNHSDFDWSLLSSQLGAPSGMGDPDRVLEAPSLRNREYFYLAGSLLKWYHFYNQTPPLLSWVWGHIVDGLVWQKDNVAFGKDVVVKRTEPYAKDVF